MAETLIKNFNQISKADTEIAGGKGASLGEMIQAGIPVPEGFVILSNAFDRFLEETDLNVEIDAVLNTVDIKEVHTVENASEKIQAMILSREMPEDIKAEILKFYKNLDCKFVAVRSSATSEDSASAAWAGQLDSFLNTTKETLLENVKKCWASLFTPRAIFYRFEKKLNKDKISVAVVVQKMVDSEESGIAFSVHPVTQDENQIIIEAGFGLGEAIVSGSITPDSYVVDKQGFSILDINVNEQTKALYKKSEGGNEWKELGEKGKKQVLTEKEIIELSKLIVKIEKHYGFSCDIEWAKEKGKFSIVQSRPITTLDKEPKQKTLFLEKQHTRDYCLLKLSSWMYSDLEGLKNELGQSVENTVFYSNGEYVKVYYYNPSLQNIFTLIAEKSSDLEKVRNWEKRFLDYYQKLEHYLKNKKTISSLEELDKFYNLYKELWTLLAIFFVIPLIPNIAEEQKKVALKLREMTQEYSEANQIFMEGMKNILKELNEDDLKFLLPEEIFNQKIITKEKIKDRKKGFIYHHNNIYTGEEIEKFIEEKNIEFDDEKLIEQSEDILKGEIGYKGIVKGKAKIIMTPKEIYNLKEGEILIAPMTTPDYIPAMKKASAFITDEGGITSHAAIVSREMKKPCIVGTKIATQIIKDGFELKVNANKGYIKILKK